MSKQTEDIMMAIYLELEANPALKKKFRKQMKKMESQEKHKYKTCAESWEYALQKVKDIHAKPNKRTTRKSKTNSKG